MAHHWFLVECPFKEWIRNPYFVFEKCSIFFFSAKVTCVWKNSGVFILFRCTGFLFHIFGQINISLYRVFIPHRWSEKCIIVQGFYSSLLVREMYRCTGFFIPHYWSEKCIVVKGFFPHYWSDKCIVVQVFIPHYWSDKCIVVQGF